MFSASIFFYFMFAISYSDSLWFSLFYFMLLLFAAGLRPTLAQATAVSWVSSHCVCQLWTPLYTKVLDVMLLCRRLDFVCFISNYFSVLSIQIVTFASVILV